jgi:hypothetical protein
VLPDIVLAQDGAGIVAPAHLPDHLQRQAGKAGGVGREILQGRMAVLRAKPPGDLVR